MKAILIDAVNRRITEVQLPEPSEGYGKVNRAIYDLLGEGTTMMEGAARLDDNDIVFVDEEGLFNLKSGAFSFDGSHPFMGNGVVCGGNDEGGSADVKLSVDQVRQRVRFYAVRPRE